MTKAYNTMRIMIKEPRLWRSRFLKMYKGKVFTVTIERGDRLNKWGRKYE